MMITRFVLIVLLLGTFGCSATYIRATTMDNPLDRIEQNAQEDWSTERVDANTLHLSDFWPLYSIVTLGYVVSHAHVVYDPTDAVLHIQYYLKYHIPMFLFIPTTTDSEPPNCFNRWRAQECRSNFKFRMNEQIDDIIQWSGASVIWRRYGKMSKIFPLQGPIEPRP